MLVFKDGSRRWDQAIFLGRWEPYPGLMSPRIYPMALSQSVEITFESLKAL